MPTWRPARETAGCETGALSRLAWEMMDFPDTEAHVAWLHAVGNEFPNTARDAERNLARFDVQNLGPGEGPHLNLGVQINGTGHL